MTVEEKSALRARAVSIARSQIGVEETPRGSNWGPKVKEYLAAVGIDTPASWCCAFAVWCYEQAGNIGTLIKDGLVQAQVDHAKTLGTCVSAEDVCAGRVKLLPGWLVCVWEPELSRYAHTGIVSQVAGTKFVSIEGNTNDSGARQGYAVMEHSRDARQCVAGSARAKYCFLMSC